MAVVLWAGGGRVEGALVINELHYAPDVKTEPVEFVELYNPDSAAADLSGWSLSGGIEFAFPPGSQIAPDAYVVIGQDPAALRTKYGFADALGPYSGKLSNQGDTVTLRNANGALVDEVEYRRGFPWPTVGEAPGYSIELVNPAFDNSLGGNWRPSVLGDAAVERELLLAEGGTWKYFKGVREASQPTTAWRQRAYNDSQWLTGQTPIGFGEPFLNTVLDDMRSSYSCVFFRNEFVVDDPAQISSLLLEAQYDDGIKVWINGQNVANANVSANDVSYRATAQAAIENADFVPFLLNAPGYLVRGRNVIAVQAFNSHISASGDFFFDLRLFAQLGSASRGPTPGLRNSVYADNAPPQIRQVKHQPEQPASGQPVSVTAKITDPEGVGAVSLHYQVVEPGNYIELSDAAYATNWLSIPMHDSGTGGDELAGDSIYSAQLPSELQVHRRLIRYRITASDGSGLSVRVPYPADPQPNFAFFVYDGVPEWRGAIQPSSPDPARGDPVTYGTNVMRRLPTYHLISKNASVEQATWFSRYGGDLYRWKGTLVYDGRVYDHIGYRARGGVWRYAMGKNMWKVDFNRGHDFEARDNYGRKYGTGWTKLNLGASIQQGDYLHRGEQGMFESVGYRLFNLAGVESPETHFVQFRIIDDAHESDASNQYTGDLWGLYLAVEQEDGRFLDQHQMPDGNFYKMEGGSGELNNQGASAATDKSDLNTFIGTYRNPGTPDDWWRRNFSLDRYYSYQAIVQGIHHYDICYGKNYFYYLNPQTGVWSVHPWDLDLTWADNMYDAGCGGTDEFKDRVLTRPAFRLEYQNRIREIRDLLFNTDQTWQLIDEYAALIDDPEGGPAFVDVDRAMWDFNPVMSDGRIVNPSKAGQGRFYQIVPTRDFPGMVDKMKNYVVTRGALLDNLAQDSFIPDLPSATFAGPADFPVNRLTFRAEPYSGPNPFAAMKWRVGEVTPSEGSNVNRTEPRRYEIEPVWESSEFTVFTPEITVPAEAVKVGRTYRARVRMKDSTGRWSHWSEPVQFTAAAPDNVKALQDNLRITEVMYNPPAGTDLEFVELHNLNTSTPLDLDGVTFTEGIEFTFPLGTVLPPGGYLLVVRSSSADHFAEFRAHYGLGTDVLVAGPYSGALNNDGEQLELRTAASASRILGFRYGDGRGWPVAADGAGHSLVPMTLEANEGRLNYAGNWRASTFLNGSPGRADPPPMPGVVLNEIVTHTDFLSELDSNDWIEIYNPESTAIALGPGWFLSDDDADLRKWEIPPSTVLQPGSWIVFDEVTGFHNPVTTGFGLSKNGEQVFLSHLPGTSADRVVDSIRFKAQENDWSFGRYPDGIGFWLTLTPRTPATANPPPSPGVVIDEIMFHPKPTAANPADNSADEYIELFNPAAVPVSLSNTNGSWRLAGGVEFVMPAGLVLGAGDRLLLVNFSPTNTAALNAFRSSYGLANSSISVVGPYQGKLGNSSERVALEKPQFPDLPNSAPAWVIVDEVIYSDGAPWPDDADGTGLSLHRQSLTGSGNDPANWRAADPTPGHGALLVVDSDSDGMSDDWERAHGLNPNSAADAHLDPDNDGLTNLQEFLAGTDPNDPGSTLRLSASSADAGTVLLRFHAGAGRTYGVFFRDSLLEGAWQPFQRVPPSSAAQVVEIFDQHPGPNGQRFYQVRLE